MATVNSSPSGFSYAQAARSRPPVQAPPAPPSKVTSGAATPASNTFSDLTSGGNWADDVEASVGDKARESTKAAPEASRTAQMKEGAVERAKSEDKSRNGASGVSSPDLAGSSSTTTKDDDSSSAPTNGSSETTWEETKSQSSEPAWIAERKERQSSSQNSDSTVKGEKKSKESPLPSPQPVVPVAPVVLQEAAPPTVNPWLKRAEEAKAKAAAQPPPAPKPASVSPQGSTAPAESQRTRPDPRKKASSIAGLPRNGETLSTPGADSRKPASFQGKRAIDVHASNFQESKPAVDNGATKDVAKAGIQTHSSLPDLSTATSSVQDAGFWPTPETAQDWDRKESPEKDDQEKQDDDVTSGSKPRKRPNQWEKLVVTPNVIWETQGVRMRGGPANGERGGRGGARPRGGFRGGANGHGDRQSGRGTSEEDGPAAAAQRGRASTLDRDTMPPPTKPNRASSDDPRREQNLEARSDRSTRGQSFNENRVAAKNFKSDSAPAEQRKLNYTDGARTKSPKETDGETPDTKDDERIPEPIPRRSSVGTQTAQNGEVNGQASNEPPTRMVPTESRKEGRGFEGREPNWNGPPRGGKRGGRGRGGSREFANGHPANHAFGNGDFAGASPYGAVPPSPSAYQAARGNHQFQYSQQGRGGWARNNPRSQSIPVEGYNYGRYGNPYAQSQLPPMQTYFPGMYEYGGFPMSAMPYQPHIDQQMRLSMVSTQLEYYFSLENLLKDMFLRQNMDSQGFVFLDIVANFNRIKALTDSKAELKHVCMQSENIEIRVGEDGKDRLRKREGWEQFLLPMEQRAESAQNDGPKTLQRPKAPQFPMFQPTPFRGPASAGLPGTQYRPDRRSYDGGYAMMNGMAPPFAGFPAVPESYPDMMGGEDARGRAAKSPLRDTNFSPMHQQLMDGQAEHDSEPDAYPDEAVADLTVVSKVNHQKVPYHSAATRTFSNGSIDSRSIFSELEKSTEAQQAPTANGEALTNGTSSPGASRHTSTHTAPAQKSAGAADISVWWVKDQNDGPSEGLPSGLTPEPYYQLHDKALEFRQRAATGTCPYDLDVLYHFWSHFLIRNFNSRMYTEFKYLANDDAEKRHNFDGLQNLVNFYHQALLSHNPVRDRLVKDYVTLVQNEPPELEGAAFKQLRSAWRNGALNLKNRKKLADLVDESLKERLES